ncbi:SDR family NAD(P)-dependent oxidoreductase [Nocardia otitidiscaviarum]|uniref:SDR family NAD(P)-dependent oxidoreductase n=1 Tax=Nocardia otitidiscaviarum TaxID=1823 RepID=A0A516NJQ1_9NOCA|nr:SDR family NAD(P)-dependent oxidoreductase [Nocardia otitidiscaviarum]MCP9619018.1 SDR family NAD(P)-dependent oxidoreductase [Nocardia otitidiscaviarum]QDP79134.1 SDR family NAD(P)-dependent oxidoreductase [Nocardia otitidiscaviarum]
MQISDQVALVTGAASGLGLATARRVLAEGGRVVLFDLADSEGAAVARELGDGAVFAPGDVTEEADVVAALDAAAALGPLRMVVNCAGIGLPGRILTGDSVIPVHAFQVVVDVNLVGTFNVLRLGAQRMARLAAVDGERGVIVNTASVAAFDGQIGQAAYAASKAAVAGMTLPLARDLGERQIRVVTVAPGMFDTPLLAALPEQARESLGQQVPHPRRLGDPDEFAALVAHIVSNPMLNGEVIRLDGGIRMAAR